MRLSLVCIKPEEYFRFISFREAYRLLFFLSWSFHLLLERLFFHMIVLCKNMATASCKAVSENSLP